jgi:hypothetical protein
VIPIRHSDVKSHQNQHITEVAAAIKAQLLPMIDVRFTLTFPEQLQIILA